MSLHIKNAEVERLATELASVTGESKTEAIRRALLERRDRMTSLGDLMRGERLGRVLEGKIWPSIPPDVGGRVLSKSEREEFLGYGSDGV